MPIGSRFEVEQHKDTEKRADRRLGPFGRRRRTLDKQQQGREQQTTQDSLYDGDTAGGETIAHEHFAEHAYRGVKCGGGECKDNAFAETGLH